MQRYVIRRVLRGALTVFGVLTITFLVVGLLPGDAVDHLFQRVPNTYREVMRHALGLDQPLHVRYVQWVVPLVTRLDMGKTIYTGEPVSKVVLQRLPVTLELALLILLVSLTIALPLGIFAARHRGSWLDFLAMQFSNLGQAIPGFWIGTLLFFALGWKLRILPSAGWVPLSESIPRNLLHLIMPTIAVSLPEAAFFTRVVRSSMLEVLSADYIRVAYAKGLRRRTVLWRHALRNALIPVLTIGGVEMGYLLGGEIIIEDIFQLPGLGKLAVQSLNTRDVPVIQGWLLVYATFFVAMNLIVDLLYSVVDPRITYE
jgi:peptide/nickel transport system permease protein